KLGKYEDVLTLAEPLLLDGGDLELSEMMASSQVRLGRLDEAAARLDASWEEILAARRSASMSLRGQIHLQRGEMDKAREVLVMALSLAPNDKATLVALGR